MEFDAAMLQVGCFSPLLFSMQHPIKKRNKKEEEDVEEEEGK